MCTNVPQESASERILEIGLRLPKLSSKVKCIVFRRLQVIKQQWHRQIARLATTSKAAHLYWVDCQTKLKKSTYSEDARTITATHRLHSVSVSWRCFLLCETVSTTSTLHLDDCDLPLTETRTTTFIVSRTFIYAFHRPPDSMLYYYIIPSCNCFCPSAAIFLIHTLIDLNISSRFFAFAVITTAEGPRDAHEMRWAGNL